jgi:hypothetical protein
MSGGPRHGHILHRPPFPVVSGFEVCIERRGLALITPRRDCIPSCSSQPRAGIHALRAKRMAPRIVVEPGEETRRIVVSFSIVYPTKWGQRIVIIGDGSWLGAWSVGRGLRLTCHHDKDKLVRWAHCEPEFDSPHKSCFLGCFVHFTFDYVRILVRRASGLQCLSCCISSPQQPPTEP